MSITNTSVFLSLSLFGVAGLFACGGGSGPTFDVGSTYENRPGDFAKPTEDNQDPSPASRSRSAPPQGEGDGSSDKGDSDKGDSDKGDVGTKPTKGCPPCDGTYKCTVTLSPGGATQQTTAMLKMTGGECVAEVGQVVLACGGQLTSGGQPVGTWSDCAKE